MRRKDREITDIQEIIEVMKKCDVCGLALFDEESQFPYTIPLNFGCSYDGEKVCIYFHGATEGKKLDLIRKNPNAAFQMNCGHNLILDEIACKSTMEYESVCGNGVVEILCDDEEKRVGLNAVMNQYSQLASGDSGEDKKFEYNDNQLDAVTVFKLTVNNISGKRLKRG